MESTHQEVKNVIFKSSIPYWHVSKKYTKMHTWITSFILEHNFTRSTPFIFWQHFNSNIITIYCSVKSSMSLDKYLNKIKLGQPSTLCASHDLVVDYFSGRLHEDLK
jgi:hypothetical protein